MSRHHTVLKELMKLEGNKECADCTAKNPTWTSHSMGCFLCIRCAGLHRRMGTDYSKVKSTSLDKWQDDQLERMVKGGNEKHNRYWEARKPKGKRKPSGSDDIGIVEEYVQAKYVKRMWVKLEEKEEKEEEEKEKEEKKKEEKKEEKKKEEKKEKVKKASEENLLDFLDEEMKKPTKSSVNQKTTPELVFESYKGNNSVVLGNGSPIVRSDLTGPKNHALIHPSHSVDDILSFESNPATEDKKEKILKLFDDFGGNNNCFGNRRSNMPHPFHPQLQQQQRILKPNFKF